MPSESPVPSNCGLFSFCGAFKGLFTKAYRPSALVLIPILQIVERASSAFPPLQSAAGGLLNVMEVLEVRRSFSPEPIIISLMIACLCGTENNAEQRRHRRSEDVLLQTLDAAPGATAERRFVSARAHRTRREILQVTLLSFHACLRGSGLTPTWDYSSIDEITDELEQIRRKRACLRFLHANRDAAEIAGCAQTLKQCVDNFLVRSRGDISWLIRS